MAAGVTGMALMAAAYGYAVVRLEETMSARNWELPAQLYPAPLELVVGKRLPPGPLGDTLEAMGYHYHRPVQKPGEYREAQPGHYYLRSRAGWPGLENVVEQTLDLRVRHHTLTSLKVFRGSTLARATIPPVAFAEIRGPNQESRRIVPAARIPEHLLHAVVAVEDRRFFRHHGIDPRGIMRAFAVNLVRGERAQGGSTLTQQLAKNTFLSGEKTYTRKIKEVFFALALERKYTKQEILALYLNEIYLGQRGGVAICGIGQAAHLYFTKQVPELELHESALLAGLIQAPNAYAPDRHPERARKRRNLVLQEMFEQGYIDEAALKKALKKPLGLRLAPYVGTRTAPYFVDMVTERLGELFPGEALNAEGLTVETTLDLRLQKAAENALAQGLSRLDRRSSADLQGAVVVLEPQSGRILALVGGRDYGKSQFDRATQSARQPGSAFKPLLALAAFQTLGTSLSPTSILEDSPLELDVQGKPWRPQNSDRQFRGDVTLRQTIEESLNVPAVRLALQTGLDHVANFYQRLEFRSRPRPLPSLALGAIDVSPLEVAAAYTPVADHGVFARPFAIARVLDRNGNILYQGKPIRHRVASPPEVYLVRDMMKGVLDRGTARSARTLGYAYEAAGKTGTTNDYHDAWFVGMDPELIAVVWVGSDSSASTGLTGASGALPVWTGFMKAARKGSPPPDDPLPKGLTRARVCAITFALATDQCPETREELFWDGSAPRMPCAMHGAPRDIIDAAIERLRARVRGLFGRQRP